MKVNILVALGVTAATCSMALRPATDEPRDARIGPIAAADFDRLLAEIKPQPGESPWREIPWLTNITEARQRAVAEDKPIVIFTAADGSPLCRT
jgi:hypothetical protein